MRGLILSIDIFYGNQDFGRCKLIEKPAYLEIPESFTISRLHFIFEGRTHPSFQN